MSVSFHALSREERARRREQRKEDEASQEAFSDSEQHQQSSELPQAGGEDKNSNKATHHPNRSRRKINRSPKQQITETKTEQDTPTAAELTNEAPLTTAERVTSWVREIPSDGEKPFPLPDNDSSNETSNQKEVDAKDNEANKGKKEPPIESTAATSPPKTTYPRRTFCKTVETLQKSLLWMGHTTTSTEPVEVDTGIRTRRMAQESRQQQQQALSPPPVPPPPPPSTRAPAVQLGVKKTQQDIAADIASIQKNISKLSKERRAKRQRELAALEEQQRAQERERLAALGITPMPNEEEHSASNTSNPGSSSTQAAAAGVPLDAIIHAQNVEKRRISQRRFFHKGPHYRKILDAEDRCFSGLQSVAESRVRAPLATEAEVSQSSGFCQCDAVETLCNIFLLEDPYTILSVAIGGAI